MNILIKGMEMPKNCRTCPMLFDGHNYRWCNITGESLGIEETDNGRDEHCPLVEIPTPHGRLIDADEFIRELASEHVGGLDAIKKYTNADTWTSGLHTAWRLIDDASTVIEAEGSET